MDELNDINLPLDADDLSKHAPALFALKARLNGVVGQGTEEGFVVPALYFDDLSELVIAKTSIPQDGGLVVPENYFEELSSIIEAKTAIPSEDAHLNDEVGQGLVVPENYFEEFGANLESHIALDNVKQDEGLVVPYNYFENLTDRVLAETSLDKDEVNNDEVPVGYFDSLHDKVVARLENEGTIEKKEERGRVIVLAQWKKYAAITAVAASVALLIAFAWTFIGNNDNGDGSIHYAYKPNNLVPDNYVRVNPPQPIIDTISSNDVVVPEGIARELPKNPNDFKPKQENEVIMNDDEIIAQSDLMDEALVMDFVNENNVVEETDEVLDPAMMEYLMNDNTSLDVFDPGNKKP